MATDETFRFEQVMKGTTKTILLQGVVDEDTEFKALAKVGTPIRIEVRGRALNGQVVKRPFYKRSI